MEIVSISYARDDLFSIVRNTIDSHEPVRITSRHGNVVLLAEEDFKAIEETLYLQSIPGLMEDVKKGRKARRKDLFTRDQLPW